MAVATKPQTTAPAYALKTLPRAGPHGLVIALARMDGAPEVDRFNEPLRNDRENWLSQREALALIGALIASLPRW